MTYNKVLNVLGTRKLLVLWQMAACRNTGLCDAFCYTLTVVLM